MSDQASAESEPTAESRNKVLSRAAIGMTRMLRRRTRSEAAPDREKDKPAVPRSSSCEAPSAGIATSAAGRGERQLFQASSKPRQNSIIRVARPPSPLPTPALTPRERNPSESQTMSAGSANKEASLEVQPPRAQSVPDGQLPPPPVLDTELPTPPPASLTTSMQSSFEQRPLNEAPDDTSVERVPLGLVVMDDEALQQWLARNPPEGLAATDTEKLPKARASSLDPSDFCAGRRHASREKRTCFAI
eukprot:gnl/TRDRNA2_/TRDRNA2_142922_c0_seq1.p1 gnl/TRDRNA2_/TRDRNA2_142922_c0~~gnl/TRDRNA2_/TRDRNA2_142922_c0_seq1.p1  ORF type:complete len:261 (-),score=23.92 gnl/TRDRNA2_/TRDRNA2_142922_c0_seq1:29-769(-)